MQSTKLTLPLEAPRTVGSQRLSLESMSRNTASCSSKSCSSFWTAALASARDEAVGGIGWPGIGMDRVCPVAS